LPLLLVLLSLLCLPALPGHGEEFTGEAYRIGTSVVNNGTSGAVPSRFHTATQYLDYPGDIGPARRFRLEMATLPAFADLSQNVNGALAYSLDDKTRINLFGGMITTPDIPILPVLSGTTEERLNDPRKRPLPCGGDCYTLKDVVYQANINLMRAYRGHFPRLGIGSRPIPMELGAGVTTKYFYEELEGGGYEAQNLNLDLGAALRFEWGYDPVTRLSDRNIKLQISGFELLPTRQKALVSDFEVYERLENRWSLSLAWEEGLPSLGSFATLGITQKSEGGRWPALGAEWDFRNLLFLRGGWDGTYLSAGATAAWRLLSVHYAIRHHELGTSLYQVSLQISL
jgi:hypothetical protein